MQDCLGGLDCNKATSGGYEWTLKDGRIVELRVTIGGAQQRQQNGDVEEITTDEKTVHCVDCKHLMFSDCYGECKMGYKPGIVRPDDSCGRGEARGKR